MLAASEQAPGSARDDRLMRTTHAEHDEEQTERPEVLPEVLPGTPAAKPGCTVELATGFCGEKVRARGLCHRHYKVLARRNAFASLGGDLGMETHPGGWPPKRF
jgi:hypothetical protein